MTQSRVSRHGLERHSLPEWRSLKQLTIMQLAQQAGLSLATVQALEHGRTRPTIETAEQLANALDVFIEQIEWKEVLPLNRPLSKKLRNFPPEVGQTLRQFPAHVQSDMFVAVFKVVNEGMPVEEALSRLEGQLRAGGSSEDLIADARARVKEIIEEDRARKRR
jgi:transcriptional regulator with XRE-family HTH domain